MTVTVQGATANASPVTGTFRDARLDEVMRTLSEVVPFRYTIRKYTVEIAL